MPGSSTRPAVKPRRCAARQMARMTGSGVKCAYWVARCRAAYSGTVVASTRLCPISSQPGRNPSSPGSGKAFCANSVAPKPMNRSSRSCSPGVGARPVSSSSLESVMAAMLSRARAGQPRASWRSPTRAKLTPRSRGAAAAAVSGSSSCSSFGVTGVTVGVATVQPSAELSNRPRVYRAASGIVASPGRAMPRPRANGARAALTMGGDEGAGPAAARCQSGVSIRWEAAARRPSGRS